MMTKFERKSEQLETGVSAPLSFKATAEGAIEGYGAIFGNVDQGGDIVEAGAFTDSLKSGRNVKMLWQHDPGHLIGTWAEISQDEKGLRVKGNLLTEIEAGREANVLVKAGALDGLSIGYRTLEFREMKVEDRWVRVIEKADLWEVSLVTFPMNPEATITAHKAAAMTQRDFERQLLRDSHLSRNVVDALMRDGFKGVQALRDSGDGDYSELLEAVHASSLINSLS